MQLNLSLTFWFVCESLYSSHRCRFYNYLKGGFLRSNKYTLSKYLSIRKGGQGNQEICMLRGTS